MTAHRFFNVCMAVAIAATLGLSHYLDDPHALVDAVSDARSQAALDLHRDLAAAKLCRKEHGPGTSFTFTADGSLVCIPRNQVASVQP